MRIAHLSDFHLPHTRGRRSNGVEPHRHLQLAVEALRAQRPPADLVVLGGDMLEEGERTSYEVMNEQFRDLGVPVHAVLGNHDDLAHFRKTAALGAPTGFPGYYSLDWRDLHLVMLYSSATGKGFGRLGEEQLLWLNQDLYANRFRRVLIFMHHPPVPTGVAWLDKIGLQNAEDFWAVLPPHSSNVLGVFVAHTHFQLTGSQRGVLVAASPAVSWQFSANADANKAELAQEWPGFNLIDVQEGTLAVRTVRFDPSPREPQAKDEAPAREAVSREAGGEGAAGAAPQGGQASGPGPAPAGSGAAEGSNSGAAAARGQPESGAPRSTAARELW